MAHSAFDSSYKKLNPEQRKAVDLIEGPVIVIAGPGTGKTSILTLRIANILRRTDTAPENILALTFTESGVHSMRKKLVEIVGAAGFRVKIYTFHGFCNDIIKNFPQEFPRIIGAQHVTDLDQIAVLEDIIQKTKLTALKPAGNPLFYLKAILNFIRDLKREDMTAKDYEKQVKEFERALEQNDDFRHEKDAHRGEIKAKYKPALRKIENSKEFAVLYAKYEDALEERRLYDYEDMIIEVLRALRKNKNLLLELQETYQYIVADEHQDANQGQNNLLELLSGYHENPNLFVVGDEKQAIFRFQGASLENFLYFKRKFPKAKVIALTKNYRSHQDILDASHELIRHNFSGEIDRVRLEAQGLTKKLEKGLKTRINIFECDTRLGEIYLVGEKIKESIGAGSKPEEIAVLFRDNRDVHEISRIFDEQKIPYVVHTDINVVADEQIKKLLHIVRAANDFGNDERLVPVLFTDIFKLNHIDVFKIIRASRDQRRPIADLLRSKKDLERLGVEDPKAFTDFYELFHDLSVVAKNRGLVEAFQDIVSRTGFIGFLLARPRSIELVSAYDALLTHILDLVERHKGLKIQDYLNLLDKMTEHGVSVRAKGVTAYPGMVNLMTAHKSKGLEFDQVFCLHLNDGRWGGRRSSSHFVPLGATAENDIENDVADERRLLYVVMTRARKEIVLTYALQGESGRELLPSRFIDEIDKKFALFEKVEDRRFKQIASLGVLKQTDIGKKREQQIDVKNKEYIQNLFLEQGFSVTALNNYLACAWTYFFLNLLRIPRAKTRFEFYGTAVHETLKDFFNAYKEDRPLTRRQFLELFENYLNRKALERHDYELLLDKGRKSLGGYYDTYKNTWPKNIFTEYNISGVHVPVTIDKKGTVQVVLRGQLDKVELLDGNKVNVVDYKTGTPKSRKEIEGETKTSEGNYKRQLVFYKILIEAQETKQNFVMQTGEIDFVEPNKQGTYKREKFEISDSEVAALKEVIQNAAKNVYNVAFWEERCDDKECEYCELADLLFSEDSN